MRTLLAGLVLASGIFGQKLEFEVASVRTAAPLGQGEVTRKQGGPGTQDPERMTYRSVAIRGLLMQAFGFDFDQSQVTGPAWIDTEHLDIAAKIPAGTSTEQLATMLQNLLAERLNLTFHHVTKDFAVYNLTLAKGGSKMKESAATGETTGGRGGGRGRGAVALDKDGFPELPPGNGPALLSNISNGRQSINARGQSMKMIARALQTGFGPDAGARVVDRTGLAGLYDFRLQYAFVRPVNPNLPTPPPDAAAASNEPALDIVTAVRVQLGLNLEKGTFQADAIVIDHLDKAPVDN